MCNKDFNAHFLLHQLSLQPLRNALYWHVQQNYKFILYYANVEPSVDGLQETDAISYSTTFQSLGENFHPCNQKSRIQSAFFSYTHL